MSTVIVGGGITGLSAAWTLSGKGRAVTLIEPGVLGGLLRTEHVDGYTIECGADSWIRAKSGLRDLAVQAGLGGELLPCEHAQRGTFILRNSQLVAYPSGMRSVAPGLWPPILRSQLIGWRTKLRMAGELLHRPTEHPDRSVSAFVRDHFGAEALEYLAEPLFAGVYGGSPEDLSARSVLPKLVEYERTLGSVIRGARRERVSSGPVFESLEGGLGRIPEALAARMAGRVNVVRARVDAVEPGRVRVNGDWLAADHILLTCGAYAAAPLLSGTPAGSLFARIPHSSATIFAFAFDAPAVTPRGFGFLVPRQERRTIVAATWVTNKFARRAPAGRLLVRCFAAGDYSESLIPEVLADLKRIVGITAEPLLARVYRWPHSLPLFPVGHQLLVEEITRQLPAGITAAGAFRGAVGMPDCAQSGMRAAQYEEFYKFKQIPT